MLTTNKTLNENYNKKNGETSTLPQQKKRQKNNLKNYRFCQNLQKSHCLLLKSKIIS